MPVRGLPSNLHLGTSSFSEKSWIGPFYPAGTKPVDMLPFYATKFSAVEVDSTYYRAPSLSMCQRWASVTPEEFRFSLKVPSEITHNKALVGAEGDWEAFVMNISPLGPKLAYLVLQFPYWNKASSCPTLGEFIKRCATFLGSMKPAFCPLVVEIRNKTWLGNELLSFLRERNLILAITHQEWMPTPRMLWDKYGPELLTGPAAYFRLLGERKRIEAITKTWEKIVIDRTEETREVISVIRSILAQKRLQILVYLNNHFAGNGVMSTDLFRTLWEEGTLS